MMNASYSTGRAALRLSRSSFRHLCAARVAGFAYHSYPLPSNIPEPPRSDSVSKASIAQPEALPRVHETRPPPQHDAVPKPAAPPRSPATSPSAAPPTPKASEVDAQKAKPAARTRSKLRPRKAAMKLTPAAVEQLRALLDQPNPKLIKVGVRNRGCSGLAYHLEYVDEPGAFDEMVEQDGVKVLIDSKALFSIIGSEMDWAEDKLIQKFVFKNPNIKEQCGCGESFMV
ncbi:iron-sulfur cluster assembly accessory [Trichoderma cornu-damae]|uniref:Iron-sulfur assembly protein 1 n=1 Tax=Trichoderma cornu-damae TaxID=654480 RepID=A0A9P8QFH0_9HYPO|nr:iron-sulfur cluster assembly accessory [Trichoderma cornu-damae]